MEEEKFVLLTDDIDVSVDIKAKEILRVRGGLRPTSQKIKWYTPPSRFPEYYSKWQEYDRMDLSDGSAGNDEVLEDGKYNPGCKFVVYSKLRNRTIRVRPSEYKELLSMVKTTIGSQDLPDDVVRQSVAKLIGKQIGNPNVKHVICQIEDVADVIALEDIFAVIDAVDSVDHDILKNEVKLYVFNPNMIYHASEEEKIKAYQDIKRRVEAGFYRKKLEYLDMLRYSPDMEPQNRDSYLRCGVLPLEGETSEQVYDRVKSHVEQLYRDFERYKDSYDEMNKNIFKKLPRAINQERNEWDIRYNDEAITELVVQGYVRYFSGLYISEDAEMDIVGNVDKRRRLRYNRSFQVTTLAIFNSDALEIDKILEIEEIRQYHKKVQEQERDV